MKELSRDAARAWILDEARSGEVAFGADLVVMLMDIQTGGLLESNGALNDVKQLVLAALELATEMGSVLEQRACIAKILTMVQKAQVHSRTNRDLNSGVVANLLSTAAQEISVQRHKPDSNTIHYPHRAQPCPN